VLGGVVDPAPVGVRVGVVQRSVPVRVKVEIAPAPTHEQAHGEPHDQEPDSDLGCPHDGVRQPVVEQHQGQAGHEERERVP
jgi:hypothetical protein